MQAFLIALFLVLAVVAALVGRSHQRSGYPWPAAVGYRYAFLLAAIAALLALLPFRT